MTYLLAGSVALMLALLVGCTFITVDLGSAADGDPAPLNIQSSNSTSVLSAQNVKKDDQAGKGSVTTGDTGKTTQGAVAVPTVSVPLITK